MGNWWDQDQQTLDRIAADTPALLDVSDELIAQAALVAGGQLLSPGTPSSGLLRISSAVKNGETVTIGADVYEVDTSVVAALTDAAHVPLDLSGGATRRASGTLTSANTGAFTAGKKVTIGAKAYTFRAAITGGSVDGDVLAGANGDAGLANLIAAINLAAGSGVTYAAAMTANAARVTAGVLTAHATVIAALDGGTAGNAIVFSTDEAKLSVDAATLGTTQIGVDPTGAEAATALVAAINAHATEDVLAVAVGTNGIAAFTADAPGGDPVASTAATATTETLTGANNAWGAATLAAGSLPGAVTVAAIAHVVTAAEDALNVAAVAFPFAIAGVIAQLHATADGAPSSGTTVVVSGNVAVYTGAMAAGDVITVLAVGA